MSNPETEQELETADVSYWADLLDSLEALEKNPHFIKVISKGYIETKALDSVSMLAVPAVKKEGQRPDVMEDLVAISNLQYHLFMIKQLGEGARQELYDIETEGIDDLPKAG